MHTLPQYMHAVHISHLHVHTHTHTRTHTHTHTCTHHTCANRPAAAASELDTTLTTLRGPRSLHTSPQQATPPLGATFVKGLGTPQSTGVASSSDRLCGVVLTKEKYYCVPSLDDLDLRTRDNRCEVENFTVGREGFGKVFFPGKTDVFGLNLDELGEKE